MRVRSWVIGIQRQHLILSGIGRQIRHSRTFQLDWAGCQYLLFTKQNVVQVSLAVKFAKYRLCRFSNHDMDIRSAIRNYLRINQQPNAAIHSGESIEPGGRT